MAFFEKSVLGGTSCLDYLLPSSHPDSIHRHHIPETAKKIPDFITLSYLLLLNPNIIM